jgi:uncharacterized protein YndB with AHSA1/START domain
VRRIETTIDIAASPERVWSVMSEVLLMPSWSDSMTSVELDPPGPLAVGSRARIVQPKLSPATWTVTELIPVRSYTWVTKAMGADVTASHTITPTSDGASVTLAVQYDGAMSTAVAGLTRKITTKYLRMEAEGLKKASERPR